MNIASRLDEAMRDAGFKSQNALAKVSLVPQATISRILKGNSDPEASTLRKLAAACDVNFEWLNEGTGPKQRGVVQVPHHGQPPVLATRHVDETVLDRLNAVEVLLVQAYRDLDMDKERQARMLRQAEALVAQYQREKSVSRPDEGEGPEKR